jgi:hypothetical protein
VYYRQQILLTKEIFMKITAMTKMVLTAALVVMSMPALSAGYLKLEGVKGESQRTAPADHRQVKTAESGKPQQANMNPEQAEALRKAVKDKLKSPCNPNSNMNSNTKPCPSPCGINENC